MPRLVDQNFRQSNQQKYPDFFNGAVPSFGNEESRFLIVGLAPGLKGANWSGRPFTGDAAGDILYETLVEYGFAKGTYKARADDGLQLIDTMITNAVRCVPPQNKPVGAEITNCRPFLDARIRQLDKLTSLWRSDASPMKAYCAPKIKNWPPFPSNIAPAMSWTMGWS